jgi:predicted metal-dependent hydrolase
MIVSTINSEQSKESGPVLSEVPAAAQVNKRAPVEIKPRRMDFPFDEVTSRYFFDNNVLKSAYVSALSATFPGGEGEFIDSVRLFKDQVEDPDLKLQIKGFIGQEGHHSHQHKQFNIALKSLGFDAVRLEKVFEKDMARSLKGRTEAQRLAFTVCFEHQTAILAEEFLENPKVLSGMDKTIADLMRWHAIEEIEHKGVAFDLYMTTVGDRALLKRAQRIATLIFSARVSKYMVLLLWWSRTMPKWREVTGYLKFMFGKGGLMRNLRKPYRDFFRDDFHPWDKQNQALVDAWKENDYTAEYDRNSDAYSKSHVA